MIPCCEVKETEASGFHSTYRVNVSSMLGIGQPSRPFIAALSWTKSRYDVSQGFHHFGHVRNMIAEIIREADELEHLLLSRGLRKVKDLQSLLWGERGACRGDEVTDVFDLWETKLGLLGLTATFLARRRSNTRRTLRRNSASDLPCMSTSSMYISQIS